jgi:hypothetical protein
MATTTYDLGLTETAAALNELRRDDGGLSDQVSALRRSLLETQKALEAASRQQMKLALDADDADGAVAALTDGSLAHLLWQVSERQRKVSEADAAVRAALGALSTVGTLVERISVA